MNQVRCPRCGKINDGTTYFCIYCGTIFEDYKGEDTEMPKKFGHINLDDKFKENNQNPNNPNQDSNNPNNPNQDSNNPNNPNQFNPYSPNQGPRKHTLAIVLGYLFAILGGLIGFIIAIYLLTRDDPSAKKHGKIQLVILIFQVLLIAGLILSGAMDYHMLFNPVSLNNMTQMNSTNITNMSNMGSINDMANLFNL